MTRPDQPAPLPLGRERGGEANRLWEFHDDDALFVSSPIVTGGRVYVGSETGGIRCLQATP